MLNGQLSVEGRIEIIRLDFHGEIKGHDVCCRSTEGVEGEMKSVL